MNRDLLRDYLAFYRDLGVKDILLPPQQSRAREQAGEQSRAREQAGEPTRAREQAGEPTRAGEQAVDIPSPEPQLLAILPTPAPENDTLERIRQDLGDCTRCPLHKGRSKLVFGVGNPRARLVFVGEGPGADEDAQGIPFVGRAGQLLTAMIENTAAKEGIPLKRPDVYICNVVKCRPPDNRTPEPDEMETCGQFLFRQLAVIRPKAICALGATAVRALLDRKEGVTRMRGHWFRWQDIPVMVTYHPSYLLRPYNQNAKRESWEDLKKVLHYVYD